MFEQFKCKIKNFLSKIKNPIGPHDEYSFRTSYQDKTWFKNGEIYFVERFDGDKFWYQNGNIHREYGPAIECSNGTKKWYKHGLLHRLDGPAIEYANGDKYWCQNGKYHRLDGPAIEHSNGDKAWFYQGEFINCSSKKEFEKLLKMKAFW